MTKGNLTGAKGLSLYVERTARAVLIVDLVESVRLIEQDEKNAVSRWLELVRRIDTEILANYSGRLIKSLGDGLLLDFNTAKTAAAAAFDIQKACAECNAKEPNERHFLLRMGIEVTDVFDDERDIYGHGVNLAARLMTLAGPGEIVVSADTRDQLTPNLDADVKDLGDCFVKHVSEPVRAYRIGPIGPNPVIKRGVSIGGGLLPTIAVLPFSSRLGLQDQHVLGDILAEELIRALSISQYLNVISRLSTAAFRGREVSLDVVAAHLNADFVLSGSYHVEGKNIMLNAELAEVKTGKVIWSDRFTDKLGAILGSDQELIKGIISSISNAIIAQQIKRSRSKPLPTLETYSLLMAAVTLMHRLSHKDFERARKMLDIVVKRAPREALPHAWIANWHVLKVQQGWTDDPDREGQFALDNSKRALDADPDNSQALAIDGFVHTNLLKKLDIAKTRYELATANNPNDPLAWLLKGTMHAFRGEAEAAMHDTRRALDLSPLDPHRYFFDSLSSTAFLAAHDYKRALEQAEKSLKANSTHTSTLRVKSAALWHLGRKAEARRTAQILMKLEPNLRVSEWLRRSPSEDYVTGREWSDVLLKVGIPE